MKSVAKYGGIVALSCACAFVIARNEAALPPLETSAVTFSQALFVPELKPRP